MQGLAWKGLVRGPCFHKMIQKRMHFSNRVDSGLGGIFYFCLPLQILRPSYSPKPSHFLELL